MKQTAKVYCNMHPRASLKWVCLEAHSSGSRGPFCVVCIEELHKDCRKEMHITDHQISEKLRLIKQDFDDVEFYSSIINMLESSLRNLKERIGKRAQIFTTAFNQLRERFELAPLEALDEYNCITQITANTGNQTIEISHKVDNRAKLKNDCLNRISEKLKSVTDAITKEMSAIEWGEGKPLSVPGSQLLTLADLLSHKDLDIKLNDNAFEISRIMPNNEESYSVVGQIFSKLQPAKEAYVIYNKVLTDGMLFKVTVSSVNFLYRHLVLGVIDSVCCDEIKKNSYEGWRNGFALWFNGYSSLYLSGTYPATFWLPSSGFKAGDIVYLEFKTDSVSIYNDDRTLDLVSTKLKGKPPMYFYLKFSDKETAAIFERLR